MWQKGRETPTFPPKHVREHISNWPQNYAHAYSRSHRPHSSFPAAKMKMKAELEEPNRDGWRRFLSRLQGYICKDLSGFTSVSWSRVWVCRHRCCCWHHNLLLISCLLKINRRSKMDMVLFHPHTLKFSENWEFDMAYVWNWMFWSLMEFVWHSVLLLLQSLWLLLPSKDHASAWIMRRSSLVYPPCTRGHS